MWSAFDLLLSNTRCRLQSSRIGKLLSLRQDLLSLHRRQQQSINNNTYTSLLYNKSDLLIDELPISQSFEDDESDDNSDDNSNLNETMNVAAMP